MILAFFPCVRFENQIMLWFRGQSASQKKWSIEKKMEHDMKLLDELNGMYKLVNKLFIMCSDRGLKLIMENPYSEEHFLRRYWCYSPAIIDRDRRERGDYFKKPTQYWFLNLEPQNNLFFENVVDNRVSGKSPIQNNAREFLVDKGVDVLNKTARSMIHPDYANRFIREFILEKT